MTVWANIKIRFLCKLSLKMFLNGQKFHISDKEYHIHSLFSCRIADVANSKRHQWLDEILIIFTVLYKKSAQSFVRKLCHKHAHLQASLCCMKRVHYSKRMLSNRIVLSFAGVLHDIVFGKQLCRFLRCSASLKKIKISSSRWRRFQLATSPIGLFFFHPHPVQETLWTKPTTQNILVHDWNLGRSIWIPHTPCGRFKKHLPQWECEFQADQLIWHF